MSLQLSPSNPLPITNSLADGLRLLGIQLALGGLVAIATYGIAEFEGLQLPAYGPRLGAVLAWTGVLNALLSVVYRSTDYWHTR
ncbi:MAG: hypothetical protein ACLFM8_04350 [Halobacteriales archaeon]